MSSRPLEPGSIAGIVIACIVIAVLAVLVGVFADRASKSKCKTPPPAPKPAPAPALAGQMLQGQQGQGQHSQGQQGQHSQGQQGQHSQGQQGQHSQGQQGQHSQQGQNSQGQQGQDQQDKNQTQQLVDSGMRAASEAARQTWIDARASCGVSGTVPLTPAATETLAAAADQTGRLPKVFASPDGDMMLHAMPGSARLNALDTAFHDGDLAIYDPDAAAQFERAMASTGVPGTWYLSEAEAEERKNKALVQAMLLEGNPSASVEDVLAAEPTMIATRAMVMRALSTQAQLASELQVSMPQRFMYTGDLTRPAVVATSISPLIGEGLVTAGQENYIQTLLCGAGLRAGAPEPY
jgi:hypothetical protein